jgi:hypothetical protein
MSYYELNKLLLLLLSYQNQLQMLPYQHQHQMLPQQPVALKLIMQCQRPKCIGRNASNLYQLKLLTQCKRPRCIVSIASNLHRRWYTYRQLISLHKELPRCQQSLISSRHASTWTCLARFNNWWSWSSRLPLPYQNQINLLQDHCLSYQNQLNLLLLHWPQYQNQLNLLQAHCLSYQSQLNLRLLHWPSYQNQLNMLPLHWLPYQNLLNLLQHQGQPVALPLVQHQWLQYQNIVNLLQLHWLHVNPRP